MRSPARLAMALSVGLAPLSACRPDLDPLQPLLGQWHCSNPRFEGCMLSFEESGHVRIWNAEDTSELHRIVSVESEEDGAVTIRYESEDGALDVLEVTLSQDGCLRMRNQETPWERQ